jgi:N-acetylneuraminic acid mutarotase
MLRSLLSVAIASMSVAAFAEFPSLPEGVTSAGGATIGNHFYMYGGHTGPAHEYSVDMQSDAFRRLDLASPSKWEELPSGPKLQGLALVAHKGRLFRIGGFTAVNKAGDDADLRSQKAVAMFDPAEARWTDLTPLPEPRSSFDAAVLGDRVYVVGGWDLQGQGSDGDWHATAWSADLTKQPLVWEPIANPTFQRRALAVVAHAGKLYAVGGMSEDGPTRRVDMFDPAHNAWSQAPDLVGEKGIEGFAPAAVSTESGLYVTSLSGQLQRLSADGSKWEVVAPLARPRFFHHMAATKQGVLLIGGANMTDGKLTDIERVSISTPDVSLAK